MHDPCMQHGLGNCSNLVQYGQANTRNRATKLARKLLDYYNNTTMVQDSITIGTVYQRSVQETGVHITLYA